MRIDSHHHFWSYRPRDYPWISPEMVALQADFLPADLMAVASENEIDGVVSVQARQSLEETQWLLELAANHELIRGVVGWVPLASPALAETLEPLLSSGKLKGVRHVVQDEPDDQFILREEFGRGVSRLRDYSLVYDILVFARHLPQTTRFVDRHPDQLFVLDHIAKPRIARDGFDEGWAVHIRELARRDHVFCKFSGVVTEVVDAGFSEADLRPYWDTVLDAFGPDRLLFGSDWPVCLLRCGYGRWLSLVEGLAQELSPDERAAIMGGNACRHYNLDEGDG